MPADFEGILFTQYHQCMQGMRSVSEYSRHFHRLSSRNNLNETEEQLIARFVQGLKVKFQEKLILQPQDSLMETIRVAEQLEKCLKNLRSTVQVLIQASQVSPVTRGYYLLQSLINPVLKLAQKTEESELDSRMQI